MNQMERIAHMEQIFDETRAAVSGLADALDAYNAMCPALKELTDYYGSPLWMQDYKDDEAGLLPADLKRGILSEDGIWNLLTDNRRLLEDLKTMLETNWR